ARDEAFARARPHAARLQSHGLDPDPPAGGPRNARGWVAEGGAAGIGAAPTTSSDVHLTFGLQQTLLAALHMSASGPKRTSAASLPHFMRPLWSFGQFLP